MKWHYEITEEKDALGEPYFSLVEYYPGLRETLVEDIVGDTQVQGIDAWSEPIVVGDSKEEIYQQLINMLLDTMGQEYKCDEYVFGCTQCAIHRTLSDLKEIRDLFDE